MSELENIILPHLNTHGVSSAGWHSVYCEYCGDGARTQGPRGGWLFNDNICFYHCFNAGCDGNLDYQRENPFSADMWDICKSFNIPVNEILELSKNYKLDNVGKFKDDVKKLVKPIKYIDLPKCFTKLSDIGMGEDKTADEARVFLRDYHIKPEAYPFYVVKTSVKPSSVADTRTIASFQKRLIIPFFKNNKIIYYTARALFNQTKKYITGSGFSKRNIIYGFDNLFQNSDAPLFVTEGFFDAFHLNGVGCEGNDITEQQIDILKSSKRDKIIVPDFNGDSNKLAEIAIAEGWGVSIPSYHDECKDVVESIQQNGKLSTVYDIMTNIHYGETANIHLRIANNFKRG